MKRWPLSVRLAAAATAVVAMGSAVLSWDALSWGAGQLGVDGRLTWLYPLTIDGLIVVGTISALALRRARARIRLYVWTLLTGAVASSVVGNAAHASGTNPVHVVGAAVPALALAASLHLLVVLVRQVVPDVSDIKADMSESEPSTDMTTVRPRPRPARDRVAALVRRHGADITTDMVALRLGISTRHASRLLAEVKRPTLVGKEATT